MKSVFNNSKFERVLSMVTGRTCENVVGAEARHIHQDITCLPNLSKMTPT